MMNCRSLVFFFALLICSFPSVGKQGNLKEILSAKDDTIKVQRLGAYANAISIAYPDSAVVLFKTIINISKKIDYHYWAGQAWLNIGIINNQRANDRLAIENYTRAIPYLKRAKRMDKVAACYLNIGASAERFGDTQRSIGAAQTAIALLEGSSHQQMLANGYKALGVIFYNMNEFSKAQGYFQKAYDLGNKLGDNHLMVFNLYGISNCYAATDQLKKANGASAEALRIAERTKDNFLLILAHASLSELYIKSKEGQLAVKHSQALLKYANASSDIHHKIIAYINASDGYDFLQDHKRRLSNLEMARDIALEKDVVIQLDDIYKRLSDVNAKLNNYKQALHDYQQYMFFKDSADNQASRKAISELDIKYQTAEKDKALAQKRLQIASKNIELERSRRYIVYSAGAAVIALLISTVLYIYYQSRRKQHARELEKIEQEKDIQLLQALMQGEERERSRIARDLHDGVAGMLAAVKMHLSGAISQGENGYEPAFGQAMNLLNEATTEVRKTAHNLMPEVLLEFGLDEALRRYCNNISNEDTLVIQYDSWGEIERYLGTFELSVYRIVQELLNNIVKHSNATQALVQLNSNGSMLSVTVEDNGNGVNSAEVKAGGMGLVTLQRRVEALSGTFEIDMRSESGVNAYMEFDVTKFELQLV